MKLDLQYFMKVKRIPENRGAGAAGPAPLFSGFSWRFVIYSSLITS